MKFIYDILLYIPEINDHDLVLLMNDINTNIHVIFDIDQFFYIFYAYKGISLL